MCYPPTKMCCNVYSFIVLLCIMIWRFGDLRIWYNVLVSDVTPAGRERHEKLKNVNVWNIQDRSGAEGINVPNISSKNGRSWIQQFPICFSTIWILKQTHKNGVADCWWFIVFLGVFGIRNQLNRFFWCFRDLRLGVVNSFVLGNPWWIPTTWRRFPCGREVPRNRQIWWLCFCHIWSRRYIHFL